MVPVCLAHRLTLSGFVLFLLFLMSVIKTVNSLLVYDCHEWKRLWIIWWGLTWVEAPHLYKCIHTAWLALSPNLVHFTDSVLPKYGPYLHHFVSCRTLISVGTWLPLVLWAPWPVGSAFFLDSVSWINNCNVSIFCIYLLLYTCISCTVYVGNAKSEAAVSVSVDVTAVQFIYAT